MAAALDQALDRAELFAVFQPQIALDTGRVAAAEALCRWTHPVLGSVPPDVFIPLAERTGVIEAIGNFMLNESLDALTSWQRSNGEITVSVNVSPLQLEADTFVTQVAEGLQRTECAPARLTLEITESHPLAPLDVVNTSLRAIRESGVLVSLDDYGVGHASSSSLARHTFDEVKLDRSLLDGNDLDASQTIRDITAEARRRGLRIVAEGIETEEQLEFVRNVGCDRGQGFLLGRPMDRSALTELPGWSD
ncbi:EAL domain-containing protein [Microbacterium sp. 4R-513]|uniref:EAL domain-containing protein n=1 Tax=Microbacterium sp. 4R-513 TaxID=2567934 RepID=UPI0013E170BD|nr:EAL domain-containing protein [Microbacterium sp. 4R-513]QIG38487.1 EAL domain-containing protein [Microbacterium sp. 4R-513]